MKASCSSEHMRLIVSLLRVLYRLSTDERDSLFFGMSHVAFILRVPLSIDLLYRSLHWLDCFTRLSIIPLNVLIAFKCSIHLLRNHWEIFSLSCEISWLLWIKYNDKDQWKPSFEQIRFWQFSRSYWNYNYQDNNCGILW